jgi:hypothetical protein
MKKSSLIIELVILGLILILPDVLGSACTDPLGGMPLPPRYTYSVCVPTGFKYFLFIVALVMCLFVSGYLLKIRKQFYFGILFFGALVMVSLDFWLHQPR